MNSPLRVLHAHAGNVFGGVEAILTTLAREASLEPRIQHAFALCFEGRLADELRATGADVRTLGPVRGRRPWTVLRARSRLRRVIGETCPDVVVLHSAWAHALFAPTARRAGPALVYWLHGLIDALNWQQRLATRTPPDLAVAVSEAARATLPRLFPRTPSVTVHAPVPLPAPALPGRLAALRGELDTAVDDVVIVCAARFEAGKGHDVLLGALAAIRDAGGWTCWLAGGSHSSDDRALEASLRDSAAALGLAARVRFLGHRRDVTDLLGAADVCCLPSTAAEGFPIVLIEALHARCAVVASDIGGIPEIVDPACGILVPPRDVGALAAALRALLADPERRRRLAAAGPARAEHLCDPQRQLQALHDLLAAAARAPRAPDGRRVDVAVRPR